MFYGREIVRVERPVDGGVQINTIYETAKGQLAVATKIRRLLPDEVKGSYRIWDHPETWSREFWLIGDKTLDDIQILHSWSWWMRTWLSNVNPRFQQNPTRYWIFSMQGIENRGPSLWWTQ